MTPNEIVKINVKALLRLRQKEPVDLVRFFRKSTSWWDKIYREERRTFPITYWDKLAKFLGVQTYELLRPGIADDPRTERRVSNGDRRKQTDRRVSQAVLSEKAMDTDIIHIVRALSHKGRQAAIGVLMDLLNDELARLRGKAVSPDVPYYTAEKPPVGTAPKGKGRKRKVDAPPTK